MTQLNSTPLWTILERAGGGFAPDTLREFLNSGELKAFDKNIIIAVKATSLLGEEVSDCYYMAKIGETDTVSLFESDYDFQVSLAEETVNSILFTNLNIRRQEDNIVVNLPGPLEEKTITALEELWQSLNQTRTADTESNTATNAA